MTPDSAAPQRRMTPPTAEQVVAAALQRCADEQGFPGAPDLDLVTPEAAAPVVVAALREAGMLADPDADGRAAACSDCERCRWQPDVDCGIAEHPHCPRCGHCMGRHGPEITPNAE